MGNCFTFEKELLCRPGATLDEWIGNGMDRCCGRKRHKGNLIYPKTLGDVLWRVQDLHSRHSDSEPAEEGPGEGPGPHQKLATFPGSGQGSASVH